MARLTVPVWLDVKSPYAYLAVHPTRDLERDYDVALDWRFYTLDIPLFLGNVDGRNDHQWRRVKYSYMDARRIANTRGLTVLGPRKVFDSRPVHAAMLFAQTGGARASVFRAFMDATFELFWKRQLDIEDVGALVRQLGEAGAGDAERFPAWLVGEGLALHDRLKDEAHDLGVFGVPSYIVDGELYWGGDRLGQVRGHLDRLGLARKP